jgi:hypothetical protein
MTDKELLRLMDDTESDLVEYKESVSAIAKSTRGADTCGKTPAP